MGQRGEASCRIYSVVEGAFPRPEGGDGMRGAADAMRACYIVIGNHANYIGIGEMVHALHTFFSRHYQTFISESLVPNATNVLIDEFSLVATADLLMRLRESYPRTRIILMATEFITRMTLFGMPLTNTFNFFHIRGDSRDIWRFLAYRAGMLRRLPYYLARYRGFAAALAATDLVLCAHQAVADTMALISVDPSAPRRTVLTLYPEIDAARVAADSRLQTRPTGVLMTGTLTKFRANVARGLIRAFKHAGVNRPIYQHRPFDPASSLHFEEAGVNLGYDSDVAADPDKPRDYLYNLNPPQRANWRYSSPMRIQRAILMGHIPLVTRKFGDHDIEDTALLWDGRPETAERLLIEGTIGRNQLIARHLRAVGRYNAVAERKNALIDAALAEMQ